MGKKINEDENQSEKLSMYTGVSMVQVLVAATSAVLGMLVWARPVFYILQMLFNTGYGRYDETFQMNTIEFMDIMYFDETDTKKRVEVLTLIGALLLVCCAITQLIIVVRSINPKLKPWIVCNIIGVVTAVAAVVLFVVAYIDVNNFISISDILAAMEKKPYFNLYIGCCVAMGVNIIGVVVNTFASVKGLKQWKKNGRAY